MKALTRILARLRAHRQSRAMLAHFTAQEAANRKAHRSNENVRAARRAFRHAGLAGR